MYNMYINVNCFTYMLIFNICTKGLLSNPAVREEIQFNHCNAGGRMNDICDGDYFQQHPLFQQYPSALQFIIYYDDIEVCNALGASAGVHKLGKDFIAFIDHSL